MLAAIVTGRRKIFDKRKHKLRASRLHVEGVLGADEAKGRLRKSEIRWVIVL